MLKRMRALAGSYPRLGADGKVNLEDRAVRIGRSNADRAAVRGDDRASDREAQSRAVMFASELGVRSCKATEHQFPIGVCDSRPGVLDRQNHLVSRRTQRDICG